MKKLVVVGIAESAGSRRLFEDQLVKVLREKGIAAVPSYEFIPGDDRVTISRLSPYLLDHGIDGITVSRVLGVTNEVEYIPPPYPYDTYMWYDPYYASAYGFFHGPRFGGYYRTYREVKLETNLYDAESGKLIWSAQSETVEPSSPGELAKSLGPLLTGNLLSQGLVAGGRKA